MDIKNSHCVFLLITFILSKIIVVYAHPFESVVTTNDLPYARMREYVHGGFVYPNSRLGMNTFSERTASSEEVTEAVYGALRFLKYICPRNIAYTRIKPGQEVWSWTGFLDMNGADSFPTCADSNPKFQGKPLRDLRLVAFPFSVKNVLSKPVLEMFLLKIYSYDKFLCALYYNVNTSDVSFSFIEASGNARLVGQESKTPYLISSEQSGHERLVSEIYRQIYEFPEYKRIRPIVGLSTNDIEVQCLDL